MDTKEEDNKAWARLITKEDKVEEEGVVVHRGWAHRRRTALEVKSRKEDFLCRVGLAKPSR